MRKISVCIPCFNEGKNIEAAYMRISNVLEKMPKYEYEIIFGDNCSTDNSEKILRGLAEKDCRVKVIINNRNFGP